MRLVYLTSLRIPTRNAHGFQIVNMCAAFASAGATVELVVPRRGNAVQEDPFEFYGVSRSFKITRIPVLDLFGYSWIPERFASLLLTFSFLFFARIYLLTTRYAVLYTREEYAGFFFKHFVSEIHMPEHLKRRGFAAEKVVVLTDYIRRALLDRGFKASALHVAPDGVALDRFNTISKEAARKLLRLPEDKKLVVYCGNFKKWKGVDTLAESVRMLTKVIYVVMVGATKESDLARITEIVSGLSNVRVEGFSPQEKLAQYMAAADLLVLPNSATDENSRLFTSPLKLFEYMAARRPILASDLPSLREVLNESNAFFFTADSAQDLTRGIIEALSSSQAEARTEKAYQEVQNYTWEKRAEGILQFLKA